MLPRPRAEKDHDVLKTQDLIVLSLFGFDYVWVEGRINNIHLIGVVGPIGAVNWLILVQIHMWNLFFRFDHGQKCFPRRKFYLPP